MNATNLTRQESHVVYHGVLQVQLGYSPGTNIFTKIQLQPIQTIIDQAYKPKIGLNRNIPTTVLQGPLEFNGISTISLIITKGYKKTQLLISLLQNEEDTGKLASTTLQYEQLDSGLTTPILAKNTTLAYQKWTTTTWISFLKLFFTF